MAEQPSHQSLGVEARELLDVLAAKLGSASAPADKAPADSDATTPAAEHPARCTGCPICAALTYLGDHRELSAQLAQGALLIVGAVRQYLDHPSMSPAAPTASSAASPSDPSQASVQRIDIT